VLPLGPASPPDALMWGQCGDGMKQELVLNSTFCFPEILEHPACLRSPSSFRCLRGLFQIVRWVEACTQVLSTYCEMLQLPHLSGYYHVSGLCMYTRSHAYSRCKYRHMQTYRITHTVDTQVVTHADRYKVTCTVDTHVNTCPCTHSPLYGRHICGYTCGHRHMPVDIYIGMQSTHTDTRVDTYRYICGPRDMDMQTQVDMHV